MRFAVILLMVVVAASVLNLFTGEFLAPAPEGPEQPGAFYREYYGAVRGAMLALLQMNRPYHSWWYLGLLGLLTLSLTVCVVDRAPIVWRLAFGTHFARDEHFYDAARLSAELSGDSAASAAEETLRRRGFRVASESDSSGVVWLVGEKRSWAHWGPWLVHAGFVLLMVGGLMLARGTYTDEVQGLPGELLAPDEAAWGFNVRVDDFQILYHPLSVGQFVTVDGWKIGRITGFNSDGTYRVSMLAPVQTVLDRCAAERLSNRIDQWTGEGRLDQANIADYVATLTVIEGGKDVATHRVEVNRPLRWRGYRFYQSSFNDRRTDAQGRWTTILTVRRDRGGHLVWAGIAVTTLGLVGGSYFAPRRVVGFATERNGRQTVRLAGVAFRQETLFIGEFHRLVEDIRSRISQKGNSG